MGTLTDEPEDTLKTTNGLTQLQREAFLKLLTRFVRCE